VASSEASRIHWAPIPYPNGNKDAYRDTKQVCSKQKAIKCDVCRRRAELGDVDRGCRKVSLIATKRGRNLRRYTSWNKRRPRLEV
jgi:hypothetical protein